MHWQAKIASVISIIIHKRLQLTKNKVRLKNMWAIFVSELYKHL
jgi:hypothetical protein